jgi:hypothetical protein
MSESSPGRQSGAESAVTALNESRRARAAVTVRGTGTRDRRHRDRDCHDLGAASLVEPRASVRSHGSCQ